MSDPSKPTNPEGGIRLNRFLAMAGIGSRRVCDELIQKGLVKVNGVVQPEPAVRVVEGEDMVEFQGKPVTLTHELHYYIFNKPRGVITTTRDPFGRPIVVDFLPGDERIYPVGRLDFDTTGALLLTNDGDVAYKLTHPKFQIPKVYQVLIRGNPPESKLRRIEAGIEIEAGFVARGEINGFQYQEGATEVQLTLREGKKREVKRIFRALGHPVLRLHRESFATLTVEGLKPGEWRELTPQEVHELKELVHGHQG